jgi:ABC-type taurine transport system ATPase subunit
MLTKLVIRNFKKLKEVEIPLGKSVVLIGPNNSGKTTALQALALWDVGLRTWKAKREGKSSPEKRPGVAINRRDLISTPVPVANLLWNCLHVRRAKGDGGTQNIRIDISLSGISESKSWECGFEFDYVNEESFVCRPLRSPNYADVPVNKVNFSTIPDEAFGTKFAFLPPMSGLAAEEPHLQPGRINVLIGQGQTAQVLRNLCYQIFENDKEKQKNWEHITSRIEELFGAKLLNPTFVQERGEITLEYEEEGTQLDISASGRGLQQTLLLLAHLYANPNTVLMLDEPDAHLEILRQRQTYNLLIEIAEQQGCQIIAASHSEVVLNEAAARDVVVAFVGRPHQVDSQKKSQVIKALREIGFDQYYQAEETGWTLYLENSTDFAILQVFARLLNHEAQQYLARPFVKYIETNVPAVARKHFFGLREGKEDLVGIAIFDHLDVGLQSGNGLIELMWTRNEIENYFCTEDVLLAYATHDLPDDLFLEADTQVRQQAMRESIAEVTRLLEIDGLTPWSSDIKASDLVLDRIFRVFFQKLNLPLQFRKSEYHVLASLMPPEELDIEITEKLDAILQVAKSSKPRT